MMTYEMVQGYLGVSASTLSLEFEAAIDALPPLKNGPLSENRGRSLRSVLHVFACKHPRMSAFANSIALIARTVCEATANEPLTYCILCLVCEDWYPGVFASTRSLGIEVNALCDAIVSKLPVRTIEYLEQADLLYGESGSMVFAPQVCCWLQSGLIEILSTSVALRVWDAIVIIGPQMLSRFIIAIFVLSASALEQCTTVDEISTALLQTASTVSHRTLTTTAMLNLGAISLKLQQQSKVYHTRKAWCGGDFALIFGPKIRELVTLRHHQSGGITRCSICMTATDGVMWSSCGDQPLRLHDSAGGMYTCCAGLPESPIGAGAPSHEWAISAMSRMGREIWVGGDGGVVHRYNNYGAFIAPLQTGDWDWSRANSSSVCMLCCWQGKPVVGCEQGGCTLWRFPEGENAAEDPCLAGLLATKGRWRWKGGCAGKLGDLWLLTNEGVLIYKTSSLAALRPCDPRANELGSPDGVTVVDPSTSVALEGLARSIGCVEQTTEIWVGCADGSLLAIRERAHEMATVRCAGSAVQALVVAGSQVWAGHENGCITVFDAKSHCVLREFRDSSPVVAMESFSNQDAQLLQVWIAHQDETITIRIADVISLYACSTLIDHRSP